MPRGQLHSTAGGSVALAPDTYTALTGANVSGLATDPAELLGYEEGGEGELVYTGGSAAVTELRASLSAYTEEAAANFDFAIRRNGSPVPGALVSLDLADALGVRAATPVAIVTVQPSDVIDVAVRADASRTLTLTALTLLATGDEVGGAVGAVTEQHVRDVVRVVDASVSVTRELAAAQRLVEALLGTSGLADARIEDITVYVAAHLVAVGIPQARLTRMAIGPLTEAYQSETGPGLRSTAFGQQAIALDTTGTLAGAGSRKSAFKVLPTL